MNIEKCICKFIKKVNTLSSIKDIAKDSTKELMEITDALACWICLLNPETNKIEYKKFNYSQNIKTNDSTKDKVKKIHEISFDLLGNNYDAEEALDFFNSVSKDNVIVEPFIYNSILIGYIGFVGKNKDFNDTFSTYVQIAVECISSQFEIIAMKQDADKKEKYRVEFLASISHEFKTPLNSIIGFSDMLKLKYKNSDGYKYIDNISKSSKFLLSLIQDVLDLSRAQTKPLELHYQLFSPKQVILDILLGFESSLKQKNIELSYTIMDIELNADMRRFKQLIYNLVSNATKFNRENGKIVIISYVNEKNEFIFEIKDTGDGISKKDCGRIFGFFTQVNRNQLKRQQGSGVGLALCKRIAQAHGGDIYFTSRLNSGSRFWFTIPIS